jgi:hypothetical protein
VLAYAADRVLLGFPGAMRGRHAARSNGWAIRWGRDQPRAPSGSRFAGRSGPLDSSSSAGAWRGGDQSLRSPGARADAAALRPR